MRYSYGAERFARSPTICLLEHKLFVAAWLRSFLKDTAAAPAIIYGGLQQQLGSWPAFSESELVRALEKRLARPGGHRFVLKAATEYGSRQLLLMSKCEWERGRWNASAVARVARSMLAKETEHLNDYNGVADPEGVERRGVVLMERYPPFVEEGGCDARELMVEGVELKVKDPLWIELKVFVVFGELTSATIYRVTPQLVTMPIYFLPDGRIERYGGPSAADRRCGRCHLVNLVEESRAAVAAIAAQIQERSGADWFRLDIFLSKVAPPRINEISYPSRSGEDPRSWVRLLCAYRQGRFRAVAGKKIWRQVAAAASLPPTARLAPNQSVPRSRSSSELLSTDHLAAEDRALFRAAKHALSRVY